MRARGITYDTGFVRGDTISRPELDPSTVRRELAIIARDLHCTAVRISGGDADRLELAASIAAGLGLEVWFSPYPLELGTGEMLDLFADCAERAERLRAGGAEVVFVAGAELTLMAQGFIPGGSLDERVAVLRDPARTRSAVGAAATSLDAFLRDAVSVVRERFGGRVTYASIPLDRVDWHLFDIVSVDLYRSSEVADVFADGVRSLVAGGKPVAITEFGSATFRGAGDVGARGLEIVEYDPGSGRPLRLDGAYDRDEPGQAAYVSELIELFDEAGVDAAFVFVFALGDHPHRPDGDPRDDLDLASYGVVKVFEDRNGTTYPDLPWEPKDAFRAVAAAYARP